jgi:hypothetical protein
MPGQTGEPRRSRRERVSVATASVTPVHAALSVAEAIGRVAEVTETLPRAQEQDAWVGVRWRISGRTFAHVYPVTRERPSGSAAMIGLVGEVVEPAVVLVFHAALDEVATYAELGPPWFKPPWSPTVAGLRLTAETDWGEVAELVVESYCVRAAQKWARLVRERTDEYGAVGWSEEHRPTNQE